MSSPLGQYYIRLCNQAGTQVAIFDNWIKLEYTNEVNGLGSYQLVLNGDDERITLFELDGQLQVYRKVPGLGKDWYIDFEGLHRKVDRQVQKSGEKLFISTGVGYNDLLSRTVIAYKEGTIRAEKNAPAETVMKEYVAENCTGQADDFSVVGRLNYDEHYNDENGAIVYLAAFPGFSVEIDNYGGAIWEGNRAYENLLSTLQDIASTTGVDFNTVGVGPAMFEFRTYINGVGLDRRRYIVDSVTGKNSAGNTPVVFSVANGTVEQVAYTYDRMSEANCAMILGEGELSLREVYTVADANAIAASPWNRREITRPGSNQETINEHNQVGYEALKENAAKESMDIDPMQTKSHAYGVHYNIGDLVTAQYDEIELHKKLTKISVTVFGTTETISIDFSDLR